MAPKKRRTHNVQLIDYMGNDEKVINAARVSMIPADPNGEYPHDDTRYLEEGQLTEDGRRLIEFLAKSRPIHWTPFAHNVITLRITAPIFVMRQLNRHRIGGDFNEVSRRYVKTQPEYCGLIWRSKPPKSVKQGSGDEFPEMKQEALNHAYDEFIEFVDELYDKFINEYNVAPEQARAMLPASLMTQKYWTGSVFFWANMCRHRIEIHAQKETRKVVMDISHIMMTLYPAVWSELSKHMNFPWEGLDVDLPKPKEE